MTSKKQHVLDEAADQIGIAPDVIIRFVSFQWIEPVDWQHQILDEEDMARARLIWELQQEFKRLGKGSSYGMNTTHFGKLLPKVNGGGAGGCPLLLIGLGFSCYDRDA